MFKTTQLIAGAAALIVSVAAFAADVSGNWNLSVETQRGTTTPTMTLAQKGEALTGTYHSQRGDQPMTGTIKGNDVKLSYTIGGGDRSMTINYEGKLEGDTISGKVQMGQMGEGKFTAKKAP
jgi:D-glucosaminate-6-phosphate ammonia-lyase